MTVYKNTVIILKLYGSTTPRIPFLTLSTHTLIPPHSPVTPAISGSSRNLSKLSIAKFISILKPSTSSFACAQLIGKLMCSLVKSFCSKKSVGPPNPPMPPSLRMQSCSLLHKPQIWCPWTWQSVPLSSAQAPNHHQYCMLQSAQKTFCHPLRRLWVQNYLQRKVSTIFNERPCPIDKSYVNNLTQEVDQLHAGSSWCSSAVASPRLPSLHQLPSLRQLPSLHQLSDLPQLPDQCQQMPNQLLSLMIPPVHVHYAVFMCPMVLWIHSWWPHQWVKMILYVCIPNWLCPSNSLGQIPFYHQRPKPSLLHEYGATVQAGRSLHQCYNAPWAYQVCRSRFTGHRRGRQGPLLGPLSIYGRWSYPVVFTHFLARYQQC